MPTFISREAVLKQKVEKKVKDKGNKKIEYGPLNLRNLHKYEPEPLI